MLRLSKVEYMRIELSAVYYIWARVPVILVQFQTAYTVKGLYTHNQVLAHKRRSGINWVCGNKHVLVYFIIIYNRATAQRAAKNNIILRTSRDWCWTVLRLVLIKQQPRHACRCLPATALNLCTSKEHCAPTCMLKYKHVI